MQPAQPGVARLALGGEVVRRLQERDLARIAEQGLPDAALTQCVCLGWSFRHAPSWVDRAIE